MLSSKQILKDGRINCLSCASDGVYDVKRMEEVRKRVWPTLSSLGISLPQGNVNIRVVGKDVIDKQALKINARGNLHWLTLTTYKIVSDGKFTRTTFDHDILSSTVCLTSSVHLYWLTSMPIYGLMRDLLRISPCG